MKNLGKTAAIGVLVGLVLTFLDVGLGWLNGNSITLNAFFFENMGYYMLYALVLTVINITFFKYLNRKVIWEKYSKYRLFIGVLGSIALTMAGVFAIRFFIKVVLGNLDWTSFIANENPGFYATNLLITMVVTVFFHAIYFYRVVQQKKVTEQKIIAGTASAKFDALKNQLDPHFLFNSLNVLTSLIEEDPDQAQKFTTSLSKVYRYVLEQKNKDLVSVDEELKFASTYIRLLQMRFEDSILFDIPEKALNSEAKIVPLSLQLLLENAVKHNVVSSEKPLKIEVFEENGMLVIRNNLQEKQVVKGSSGVGLQNIQERYKILSNKKVIITKSATEFTAELPMLTKQISSMKTQKVFLEDKRYEKAKDKVERIKAFYGNLIAYCLVMVILAVINYSTTSFPWVIFPALGWGFGVVAHGMDAYDYNPLFGKNWEERKMREYMNDDRF